MAVNAFLRDQDRRVYMGRFNEGKPSSMDIARRVANRGHLEKLGCITDYQIELEGRETLTLFEVLHGDD